MGRVFVRYSYHFNARQLPTAFVMAEPEKAGDETGIYFHTFTHCRTLYRNRFNGRVFLSGYGVANHMNATNHLHLNPFTVKNLLYIVAVVLLIGWVIGVFAYSLSGLIHIALVIAVIAVVVSLVRGKGNANI